MKKTRKLLATVLSLVMILTALPLTAVTAFAGTSGDFEYEILGDSTAEITGYTGSATNLTIPSKIDGYTVTFIGDGAFLYNEFLISVTIPGSVTSIGDDAFFDCTSLDSITIPDSVTSIGYYAFHNTAYYKNESNWENDVLYIGNHLIEAKDTFSGDYTVKDGTRTIADFAFLYCKSLTSVTIPESVTSIGDSAFWGCESLESITIPDSVTSIGDCAFYECTSLESITIPDSVTSIGNYAFSSCTSLESITIPDSVTSIGDCAFVRCTSLTSINVSADNANYTSVDGVLFNKDKTELICYPAGKEATTFAIPDGVTSIGDCAFYECTSLESITIPDSVTSIGDDAFYNTAYYNNESNWENDVLYIDNHLIKAKDTVSGDYTVKDGTKIIADDAFSWCPSLESITIPDSVTSIGDGAFYICESLESITIPDSVTSIGDGAFVGCTSLKSVTIPDSVTSIGAMAFLNCESLTSVTIPDSVTNIGDEAFGYYYEEVYGFKFEGFTIYGYAGSEAERYANENEFAFIALEKPEPAPSEASGDVNGDEKLSTVDAKWILQNLAITRELTDEQKAFADVNGDGKLSVVDAKWILQALAGLRELG